MIVDGIVGPGLTLIASRPQTSLTFLALDIALAVDRGGSALGNLACERGAVLFVYRFAKLDKKQQEQIWDIVREPGLLDELATENRPSRSELDAIVKRHPDSLAPAIRAFGSERHDLLVEIADVHQRASDRFDAAVSDLDADTQQAFRDLVDQFDRRHMLEEQHALNAVADAVKEVADGVVSTRHRPNVRDIFLIGIVETWTAA